MANLNILQGLKKLINGTAEKAVLVKLVFPY